MRTLITGIGGFTGGYLARELADRGHEVHGLVHHRLMNAVPGVTTLHVCDLKDIEALSNVIHLVQPDNVIHLAAIAFVAHQDIDEMYSTNIVGTRHLLNALSSAVKLPRSVLIASSANIYGNARAGSIDEETPPAPANDYGVTKVAAEYVASLYTGRLPLIVTRPFNYTGVGQASNFIIPKIVEHIRRGATVIELGNLDVARDFSDVRSVANIYARLLDCQAAIGGTFNVCSGRAISLAEILDLARQISGRDLQVRVNPDFVRANEVKHLCGDPIKLEGMIGPSQIPPFEQTLRWMLEA